MDIIKEARQVFDTEIDALVKMRDSLDQVFVTIVEKIVACKGKIILCAIGKPGHVATKIAATMSSLGTSAVFLHPAEAMHGDLGMISENDIVMIISYSGESDEVIRIIPNIKLIGAPIIAITSNRESTLAKNADIIQILPDFEEACRMGLAPTSSTTVEMCYGDALAVIASMIYGFDKVDFGKLHPAGALGKKLILKVKDLMHTGGENALIDAGASLKDAIIELNKKGLGAVSVVDDRSQLLGIITDGDLRRQLEKGADIYHLYVSDIMVTDPVTISPYQFAVDAMRYMKEKNISCILVTEEGKAVGTLRLQDVVGAGIVG